MILGLKHCVDGSGISESYAWYTLKSIKKSICYVIVVTENPMRSEHGAIMGKTNSDLRKNKSKKINMVHHFYQYGIIFIEKKTHLIEC